MKNTLPIFRQYAIVLVNLDPTIGSKIKKTRPCVTLSPNEMNKHLQTIMIAPITSQSKPYPSRVAIDVQGNTNWLVLDQIRTIDKSRILKHIAHCKTQEQQTIKDVLREMLVE
jgi:mRNA interferase MazF